MFILPSTKGFSGFPGAVAYEMLENLQSGEFGSGATATSVGISNASSVLEGGAWSVGGWVKPTDSSGTNQAIISSGTGISNEMILSYDGSIGQFRGTSRATSSTNQVTSSTGNSVNKWHHIALTFDGTSSIKMYVNGVADGTGTGEVLTNTGVSNLKIGDGDVNVHGTGFFTGNLDQVFLFDKELTATEVANIISTKTISGPSALYRLNGNANDETGNYNGTATNLSFSTSEIPYTSVSSNGTYILPSSHNKSGNEQSFRLGTSYSLSNEFSLSMWFQVHDWSTYPYGQTLINLFGSGGENGATDSNSNINAFIRVEKSGPGYDKLSYRFLLNNTGPSYEFETNPNSTNWYHFVTTIQDDDIVIYLNGSQVATWTQNNTWEGLGQVYAIADYNGDEELDPGLGLGPIGYGSYEKARCADVAIFDYKLTATQASNIYNNREYVNPIAIWRLDGNRDDETGTHSSNTGGSGNYSTVVPY